MPGSYNNNSDFFFFSGSHISRKILHCVFMLFYTEVIYFLNCKELMERFLQFCIMLEMLSRKRVSLEGIE